MQEVSSQIKEAIDAHCVKAYDGGHRSHLGASIIGENCKRMLWYIFRWTFREKFDGRMFRLFNRGHREEERFIEWLKGIGSKVWEVDELTGKQHQISDCHGHFGGSLDGICELPPEFGIFEPVLLEFKTNGTGAAFKNLLKNGMQREKPQHWAQTCTCGYKKGIRLCLYMNICKNDDEIHVELVELDLNLGKQMVMKAEDIIRSQEAPPRLSKNSTFDVCKWCKAKDICHFGAQPEKNCRSCKHALPGSAAVWFCNLHKGQIPKDFILKGCEAWSSVTENG